LQIKNHLESRDLLHRQIGRSLTAENAAGVAANHAERITVAGAIAHETADGHLFTKWINRGNCMAIGEGHQQIARPDEERISAQDESINALRGQLGKRRFNLVWVARI